jgi:sugar phosphate permease
LGIATILTTWKYQQRFSVILAANPLNQTRRFRMSNVLSPSLTERPTRVRYLVVSITMLMSVLLYLDRFCISFAERLIKEDLGLSNDQMGWILSAFFWSYALGQVPSG